MLKRLIEVIAAACQFNSVDSIAAAPTEMLLPTGAALAALCNQSRFPELPPHISEPEAALAPQSVPLPSLAAAAGSGEWHPAS